ncbi:tetratricopeptide repeat protein 12-like [Ciona intestinalis]
MQSVEDKQDFDNFLAKVSSIDSIVKGLTSEDVNVQAEALEKADEELNTLKKSKTFDKTVINKNAYKNDNNLKRFPNQHTSQDDFLSAMEADCQQRANARKERHKKATKLKELGNEEFKKNNFDEAIRIYTEATKEAKDLTPLYTNRAAAYLKLGKCEEAVADCDFSLRIDERWVKAFVFKGRAYQKLNKFDDAIEQFKELLKIDEKNTKLVQKYIDEVEEDRRIFLLEAEAEKQREEEKQDPVNIPQVIQTLRDRMQEEKKTGSDLSGSLMYYAGGLRILQAKLVDENSRTLFRMHHGFNLFTDDGCIANCLKSRLNSVSANPCHGNELVSSAVCLLHAACINEPENLRMLVSLSSMPDVLLSFLTWPDDQVKRDVISLFQETSFEASTRLIVTNAVDCAKFGKLLLSPNTQRADANTAAATTLCNFTLEKKFLASAEKSFEEEILPCLIKHLNDVGSGDYEALTLRMRCFAHFVESSSICTIVANNESVSENIKNALDRCVTSFKKGLTNPCAMEDVLQVTTKIIKCNKSSTFCCSLAQLLYPVVMKSKETGLLMKSLTVMSLCMEGLVECTEAVYKNSGTAFVKQLYKLMKHNDVAIVTYSLKIMCFIGQSVHAAVEYFASIDKDYATMRQLLMNESKGSISYINQSHVAMLLGIIAQMPHGLDPILAINKEGEVVRHLLVLCRDSSSKHCRANCAIAVGKMAQANGRFLEELRKHDGINILARNKPPDELLA